MCNRITDITSELEKKIEIYKQNNNKILMLYELQITILSEKLGKADKLLACALESYEIGDIWKIE